MQTTATLDRERAAIVGVALDYFEGWFTADDERMRRALHPQLAKRCLDDEAVGLVEDSATTMVDATAACVGLRRGDPGEIGVEVFDVYDRVATAVVRSERLSGVPSPCPHERGMEDRERALVLRGLTQARRSGQLT